MKATDLALARAAQHRNGQQQQPREIRTMNLGEGWGLLGFEIHPVKSQDGTRIGAMLFAVGTKQSLIASTQMTIVKAAIAPLAEVDPAKLREAFEATTNQPKESEPTS